MLWIASVLKFNKTNGGSGSAAFSILLFMVFLGFNEPLALIASTLKAQILLFRFQRMKSFALPLISLILSILVWYYLLAAPAFNYRYAATVKPGSGQFIKSVSFSILLVIYHIGKSLIYPLFWVCGIFAARPVLILSYKEINTSGQMLPPAVMLFFTV